MAPSVIHAAHEHHPWPNKWGATAAVNGRRRCPTRQQLTRWPPTNHPEPYIYICTRNPRPRLAVFVVHRPQLRRYARRGAHAYSVVVVTRRQGHALGVGVVSTVAMQGGAEEAAGRCAAAAAAVAHGAGCSAGCCREAQAGAPGPEGGFQGCGGAMQARDEARRHSMQEVLVHPAPPTSTLMTPARPSRGQLPI